MAQASYTTSTSEKPKLAVLMPMALMYADALGAEPDAVKRYELPDRGDGRIPHCGAGNR
jgi:hypothetical protein